MFFVRHPSVILEEFSEFASSKLILYLGVFLAAVSAAFIIQTDNSLVTAIASVFAVLAIILVVTFLFYQLKIIPNRKSWRLRKRKVG
jgi:hypothetical protein